MQKPTFPVIIMMLMQPNLCTVRDRVQPSSSLRNKWGENQSEATPQLAHRVETDWNQVCPHFSKTTLSFFLDDSTYSLNTNQKKEQLGQVCKTTHWHTSFISWPKWSLHPLTALWSYDAFTTRLHRPDTSSSCALSVNTGLSERASRQ